jgi:PAS domain-containing protein
MTADGKASFNIKAFFRTGPIRWLVFGGAFLIAAITIGTTIMAGNFRERALNSRERELENTVLLLARQFDQHLDDFTIVEKDLAAQIQSTESTPETLRGKLATFEWHEVLKTKVGAYSDIAGVNLFDAEGRLINSSETWPVSNVTITDRAFFKAFKSGTATTPILMELVEGRFSEGWATVIAHKVVGQRGEFIGIVTRAIAPASFEKFFESMALGDGAAITMYLRDGTLLARYPHLERLIGRNFKTGLIHRQILSGSDHGTTRLASPMDGLDRLAAARALTNFPISIIATTTVAAALDDWREQTRSLIAVAGLFVVVIAALLFLVVRKLSQQHQMEKQRLDTAINNMTQGLLLFDASQRLVVCNHRYIEMYGLSAEVLKPGRSFREVIAHRKATGSFVGDVRRILLTCPA